MGSLAAWNCQDPLFKWIIGGTAKGNTVSAANYIAQFRNEFEKWDYAEFPVVAVYNAGSFMGNEIPIEAQIDIMELIGGNPNIEMVIFKSRPELITDEALALIREKLGDRKRVHYRTLFDMQR